MFAKEKNHLSLGQCTRQQKCFGNGKIKGSLTSIASQILKSSSLVSIFSLNQEAIAAEEGYFADLMKNHYRDGIMVLEHRWNKCISLRGDYVEK
jgi:hypothetical protein